MFQRRFFTLTIIALVSLMVPNALGGVALAGSGAEGGGQSLSASGAAAPVPAGYSLGPAVDYVPVNDGGFENGPPPASSWFEFSTTDCEWIIDPNNSGYWFIPSHGGWYAWWGGGYCDGSNTNLIAQVVQVPPLVEGVIPETALTFFTNFLRVEADDPPNSDWFVVIVNRRPVLFVELNQANNTWPDWTLQQVDLTPWAGRLVLLRFLVISRGQLTGNVLVDDVGFGEYVPPPPPPNDEIENATLIEALPFGDNLNTNGATDDPGGDPPLPCVPGEEATVWYTYTPAADGYIRADTFGSNYDTVLAARTGTPGNLTNVACNDDAGGSYQSQIEVAVEAGVTYYIEVAEFSFVAGAAGKGGNDVNVGGQLVLTVDNIPPP